MNRLTRKFGEKVILPTIPMEINSQEDLEKFHKVRKEYENMAIKLSEYEDREEITDCEYCCGDVDYRNLILSNGCDGIYIDGEGNLVGDDEFNFKDKKINYCPICGKKL